MREALLAFLQPPISSEPSGGTAKLAWVVRLRWVAIAAQLGSIPAALHFRLLEEELLPLFAGVIALLAVCNVATRATLPWLRNTPASTLIFQLGADVLALSGLLALTGGAWNPLVPLLFVHAGLGALLLEGRQSLAFFALLTGCMLLLQGFSHIPPGLEGRRVPAVILFPAQLLVALVFWILTAWLSRTLNALHQHSSLARERQTRIDRLRAVGALAAGLSHEFATPLNTAQLKLSRIARRNELAADPDLETARQELRRCADVLHHMTGGTLQPESLELELVDVPELVAQVCSTIAQLPDGPKIDLRSGLPGPRRALLPTLAFSQALLNLIDNAVEAGGRDQAVEVRVSDRAGCIEVAVLDRGGGWPQVVRHHLGQPFVTTKRGGVGLGLYFVHTLAEALGAELRVEDRPGGGAAAVLSLPAAPPLATAAEVEA